MQALATFSEDQLVKFVKFVWGSSRISAGMALKIQAKRTDDYDDSKVPAKVPVTHAKAALDRGEMDQEVVAHRGGSEVLRAY